MKNSYKTPKNCIVHRISLKGNVAEIGYRCAANIAQSAQPHDEHGRTGPFKHDDGAIGTYPQIKIRGVKSVDFRGISISGTAHLGFVLSPASAVCSKGRSDSAMRCKLVGDLALPSLAGAKRKRRR